MADEIWVDGKVAAWREPISGNALIDQARTIASLREQRQRRDSQKRVYCVSAGEHTFGVLATGVADARRQARVEYRKHMGTEPTGIKFYARRV